MPKSRGFWLNGVAKVLSIRVRRRCRRDGRQFLQVEDVEVGIGRRLGEHQARRRLHRRLDGLWLRRRHHRHVDAQPLQHAVAELPRAAVAIGGGDHVLAGPQHGEQRGGDGAHAGRPQQGVVGVIEGGDLALRGLDGGVAVAPVLALVEAAFLEVDQFLRVAEHVRRGLVNRHRQRVRRALLPLAAVHRTAADTPDRARGRLLRRSLACHGKPSECLERACIKTECIAVASRFGFPPHPGPLPPRGEGAKHPLHGKPLPHDSPLEGRARVG